MAGRAAAVGATLPSGRTATAQRGDHGSGGPGDGRSVTPPRAGSRDWPPGRRQRAPRAAGIPVRRHEDDRCSSAAHAREHGGQHFLDHRTFVRLEQDADDAPGGGRQRPHSRSGSHSDIHHVGLPQQQQSIIRRIYLLTKPERRRRPHDGDPGQRVTPAVEGVALAQAGEFLDHAFARLSRMKACRRRRTAASS